MAESIFARVSRLLSATLEDAVDRMEQAGGDAVMREAIREADRAIDEVKVEHQSTMARRLNAARQQKMLTERVEELTTKATFALKEGREDLAEAALSRQLDFETQAKKLDDCSSRRVKRSSGWRTASPRSTPASARWKTRCRPT
jgi:phage shock protein A